MEINIIYGGGGFCENCNPEHDHPLNNIIFKEIVEPDAESILIDSAKNKLRALGLTEEEINALNGR